MSASGLGVDWMSELLHLSHYVHHVELTADQHLLTHGIFGRPFCVRASAWEAVQLFREPRTLLQAAEGSQIPLQRLQHIAEKLVSRRLLIPVCDKVKGAHLKAKMIA